MDDDLVQAWRDGAFNPNSNEITEATEVRSIPTIVEYCILFLSSDTIVHYLQTVTTVVGVCARRFERELCKAAG
jgi:hypothetical protein